MKPRLHLALVAILAFAHPATAQDIIKANNNNALNLPASWHGGIVPGPSNVAVWNSTSNTGSLALGANQTWAGLRHDNSWNNLTIAGPHTLTLGAAGIVQNNTTHTLAFSAPVVFATDCNIELNGNERGVTFTGGADLGGNTLTILSNSNNRFIAGSVSNGRFYSTGPHNVHQYQFNATATGNFLLSADGEARVNINSTAASSTHLDILLEGRSHIQLGVPFDNQTLQIGNLRGDPDTAVTPAFQAASGHPVVVRTLAIHQTEDATFAGQWINSNNNRSLGITKSGSATLTVTHPFHEYSGPTTISGGTLRIAGEGRINHRPIPNQAAILGTTPTAITIHSTLHFDSTATQELTGPLTGAGTLRKSSTGFLTYAGDGSGLTGNTPVDGGRFILAGTLGGNVSVGTGAAFGGTGSGSGHLTTGANATLLLAGGTTTGAPTFHGVTIGGPTYIEFASPQLDATVYEVLNYGDGGLAGYENLIPLARGTLSHDVVNKKVIFTAIAPATRTWNVADGTWDSLGALENWAEGDKVFIQGDNAIFNTPAADTTVALDGLLAPGTVAMNHAAGTYTFAGTGGLAGGGILNQTGDGILQIASKHPFFTGTANIQSGILRFIDGGGWGSGPIASDATIEVDITHNLGLINNISGTGALIKRGPGTLTLTGPGESTFTGPVIIEAGRLMLRKASALGYGNSGAISVTVLNGGQLDLADYADTLHKERMLPWFTYTLRIAGNGNGEGAIINSLGGGLRISAKDLEFGGVLNLELLADASLGGLRGFDVGHTQNRRGLITGNGHTLTKKGDNTIYLRAPATNLHIVVEQGVLAGEEFDDSLGGPTGTITVMPQGSIGGSGPVTLPNPVTLHAGAKMRSMFNWYTTWNIREEALWTGPITLLGNAILLADPWGILIDGTITGTGGIIKDGLKTVVLSAMNTYSGPTNVVKGTLRIQQPYLSNTSAVIVAAGATLDLDFIGTDTIGALTLGGVAMEPGTYNATTHPGLLAGTGSLQVGGAAADYDDWSSSHNLIGGPDDDDDLDGLSNFREYAFGLNPTDPSSINPITPPDTANGTFTYTRRKPALTGLAYTYESSTTLATWQPFTPPLPDHTDHGDPVETITVTIPAILLAEPGLFIRTKAGQPWSSVAEMLIDENPN